MKKIIQFLPIAAIILGSGLAMASTKKMNPHNVYLRQSDNTWQDLTVPEEAYHCPGSGYCTAYKDANGDIWDESDGTFTLR